MTWAYEEGNARVVVTAAQNSRNRRRDIPRLRHSSRTDLSIGLINSKALDGARKRWCVMACTLPSDRLSRDLLDAEIGQHFGLGFVHGQQVVAYRAILRDGFAV